MRTMLHRLMRRLMHWMLRRLMRRMLRRLMGRLLRRLMHRMVHGLAGFHRGRRGRAAEPAKLTSISLVTASSSALRSSSLEHARA